MKARPECIACMFKQLMNTVRLASDDDAVHLRAMQELGRRVQDAHFDQTPAALSQDVYTVVTEVTGVADPYADQKRETNRTARRMLTHVEALVQDAPDPLDTALHLAAAGNIIDAGIGHAFDIEHDVIALLDRPFAISAIDQFRDELRPGRRLLYLGDNAGEIVFDTVLVKMLTQAGLQVTYTVKAGPIINDATLEDAVFAGMPELATVITTGSNAIGVDFARVSAEFMSAFRASDIILGKGHGNFETCNERPENLYFLLKAKCPLVAEALGVALGDIVFAAD